MEVAQVENVVTGTAPWISAKKVTLTPVTGVDSLRSRYLGSGESGLHFPSFSGLQSRQARDPLTGTGSFLDCYKRHWILSHKGKIVLVLHLVSHALGYSRKTRLGRE